MGGSPGRRIPAGEAYLLDLIAGGSEWMERDGGGRGGGAGGWDDLGAAEEQKLELRLGPPGRDDWPVAREEKNEAHPVRSPVPLPRPPKCGVHTSAGAKRGFMDTLVNDTNGLQQHQPQKPSFFSFASAPAMVNPTSHNANGTITQQQQKQKQQQQQQQQLLLRSLERVADPPASAVSPVSKSALASRESSQLPRTAPPAPVVGWPPIRSFRKNLASSTPKPASQPASGNPGKSENQESCSKGMIVKINMDGIPIGRKVDLRAYDSYAKLSSAVDELFSALLAAQREAPALGGEDGQGPGQAITGLLGDGGGEYTLVYKDTEGDVLLVGDVPWNMFVSAVRRLRVLKSSELPALSLAAGSKIKRNSATEPATDH